MVAAVRSKLFSHQLFSRLLPRILDERGCERQSLLTLFIGQEVCSKSMPLLLSQGPKEVIVNETVLLIKKKESIEVAGENGIFDAPLLFFAGDTEEEPATRILR